VSTINAQNYGDGTDSVPASAVLQGTAKAWAAWDNDGTFTTRETYNVSSLTDDGVGIASLNITNSFSLSILNYLMSGMSGGAVGAGCHFTIAGTNSNTMQIVGHNANGADTDFNGNSAGCSGDLA